MENKTNESMSAFEFLKERARMCQNVSCKECGAYIKEKGWCKVSSIVLDNYARNKEYDALKKAVEIVEKWSKEHPARTRQDMLLETFPEAKRDENGVLIACPQYLYEGFICENHSTCVECRKEFWSGEAPAK